MRIGDARSSERGITLFELLMVCGIIGLLAAIAIPIYQNAMAKARRVALAANFTELYSAFMRYHVDFGHFPTDTGAGSFDIPTLAPLSTSGYFPHAQTINDALQNHQAFFYWAPDWEGPDSDFIIAGRSATDPAVLVYAMHYDFGNAFSFDGVYLVINGVLVRADGRT
jgi:Tfp pilus assembly protein PilE